jgi:uncharacterized protein YggE
MRLPHPFPSCSRVAALTLATAATAALLAGCGQPAQVTVQGPSGGETTGTAVSADGISVSGVGEVSGAPDTLSITFAVTITRDTVGAAVADNASATTKVLDSLKANGIDEKDVRTTNYNVSPNYDYEQGKQVPKGFQVTNAVVVKDHDLPKAGTVMDGATSAGGNDVRVQGVSFTLEDDEALLASARDKAYANAKSKADQFAKLSGRPLGAVISINETTVPQPTSYAGDAVAASAGAPATTPVNPGQVTTNLQVQVRYSFG